jgi:RHS repeat-associated protein
MDIGRTFKGIIGTTIVLCGAVISTVGGASDTELAGGSPAGPSLSAEKRAGTEIQLIDGRQIVVGGSRFGAPRSTVVLSHVSGVDSGSVEPVMKLIYPRAGHSATVLSDGTFAVIGGVGADGKLVGAVEIIDPTSGETQVLDNTGITPRSQQTATLLASGEVLVTGGLNSQGLALSSAQLWNPQSGQTQDVAGGLIEPRAGATATLLPDGDVLISGGTNTAGRPAETLELFSSATGTIAPISPVSAARLSASLAVDPSPSLSVVLPPADSVEVAVNSRIAVLLSSPIVLDQNAVRALSIVGPAGAVAGKVVATNGGALLFFSPSVDLLPGATYTVFLRGAKSRLGTVFPFSASSFTTQSFKTSVAANEASRSSDSAQTSASAALVKVPSVASVSVAAKPSTKEALSPPKPEEKAVEKTSPEDWIPQEKNRHGSWRVLGLSGDPVLASSAASINSLSAAPGQTALAGRVLRYHGMPLPGVKVSIGSRVVTTDSSGRFLLTGLSAGVTQVKVDGTAVTVDSRHYTQHFIRVELIAGSTVAIPNPVYLPRVDPATEVTISSPAAQETVLTHPGIPGLEVHIPKGAVLREFDGKIVTKLSITPIPLDRPPYPTPVPFTVYFTLQPGGAFLEGNATKPIRVIYPNYQGLPAGARASFWNYDPNLGWQVYGEGTVSSNGKQVIPDANVGFRQIISFGMGISNAEPEAKTRGAPVNGCVQGGDPVDCATGLFLHFGTDLVVNDIIPISVSRTYRQNDPVSRAFGIGTNLSYNMFLYTGTPKAALPPEIDLVLSDGSTVPYQLVSGTGLSNAIWKHTGTPSAFYGSTLAAFNSGGTEGFSITMRDKTVFKFAPHSPNGLSSITDRNGNTVTLSLANTTVGGQINKITSPSGRYIQLFYNANGVISQATDNTGRSVFYGYENSQVATTPPQNLQRLKTVTDANGKTESFSYDSLDRMTTVTDKRGNTMVTNIYDANNRVQQQTLADSAIWLFSYALDGYGNVTQTTTTDPNGNVRQDTFNSSGYLTQQINALGKPEQQTITVQRDASNQVQSVIDAPGRVTQFTRDGFGNVTAVTRLFGTANAVTDSYTYDTTYQQVTSHTDALGYVTTLGYDPLGNLTSATDALGNTTQVTNDSLGRPTAVTNPLGMVTQLNYAAADLSGVIDPLGRSLSILTDELGRTSGVTDPLGHNTRIRYDALDRPLSVINALGGQTMSSYDGNGNVLTVQDPRAAGSHGFSYDPRNRVHVYTDPVGATELYNYDGMGNLTSKVDRKNQTTGYQYDGLNRLHVITYADASTLTITWDAANRPTQFVDSINGTITRQYDGLDRMTEEVTPQGQVDYVYDAANRRNQLTVSGYSPVTYQYDNANRLTQIAQGANVVGLGYDAANRRSSVTLPNGIVATPTFDAANQLLSLSYDLAGTHIGDLAYTYDAAGRRITQSGSLATLNVPASVSSASYNAANRLTNWGGSALSYDANGNLTNSGASTYSWNSRNQLIATSDGGGAFSYDATGRRSNRTVAGVSTPYVNDGANPATMGSTSMLAGQGLDEFYAESNGSGTTTYLTDALGSPVAATNSSGTVVGNASYGAYGTTSQSGATTTSFQYTGRENDTATNLYYFRNRYYSPILNRFVSEDPIGLNGGMNAYAYVDGNPISEYDPLGLMWAWGDPINPTFANEVTGFGDGVSRVLTFGITSTSNVRAEWGIDGGIDTCSAAYRGGKYTGWAWGALTFWAGGLNGGANPTFWSGYSQGAQAAALGIGGTIESTQIGATLSFLSNTLKIPGLTPIWAIASGTFALNASGTATAVIYAGGAIWSGVEAPLLAARGIPIFLIH